MLHKYTSKYKKNKNEKLSEHKSNRWLISKQLGNYNDSKGLFNSKLMHILVATSY